MQKTTGQLFRFNRCPG